MIRLFAWVAAMVLTTSVFAQATQLQTDNPNLVLDGNNVNLNFNITGMTPVVRDVRIMFCGSLCQFLTENTQIQNAVAWASGSQSGITTTKQMVQSGWIIQSVFSINSSQFYIVFVK
jgi:hypothetical protein